VSPGILVIVAAVLGFVALAGLGLAFAGGGQGGAVKRARAIGERGRLETRARPTAPDPTQRRKQILKTLKEEERKHRKATVTLAARLNRAGVQFSVRTFWIISAGLGGLGLVMPLALGQKPLVGLLAAVALGLGLPRWVLGVLAKRRSKKFVEAFPDAADIIVRGIRSGLPVHECLLIIGRESPEPMASEFRRLVDSVGHGLPMEQALERMYERMPIQELRFFSIVLGIQQKTGGNLAEALGNLSAVLRARKLMREKVKALASEATASAMIIGSLPPAVILLISVTTPSYLSILFTDPRGHLMLMGGAFWMAVGVFIMRRMINFKF
jgi:tight adherence protein B